MIQQRSVLRFAKDAEDVATELAYFRDNLPQDATQITATIAELYRLSTILHRIAESLNLLTDAIEDDLDSAFASLRRTLDCCSDGLEEIKHWSYQLVWHDLSRSDGGSTLVECLQLYCDFLSALAGNLHGERITSLPNMKRQLLALSHAQRKPPPNGDRQTVGERHPRTLELSSSPSAYAIYVLT